jgi:hypothetical protein
MTLTAVLRRMKVAAVRHGLRSTFGDWVSERTNYPRNAAEMAHSLADAAVLRESSAGSSSLATTSRHLERSKLHSMDSARVEVRTRRFSRLRAGPSTIRAMVTSIACSRLTRSSDAMKPVFTLPT